MLLIVICPEDVNCQGSWSTCNADCQETYTITTAQSGPVSYTQQTHPTKRKV